MRARDPRPDPAAHLLAEEEEAWLEYRGRWNVPGEVRDRWHRVVDEIEWLRREIGWPAQ